MMNSSSENEILTPESVTIEANNAISNLLPAKSKEKYLKAYENFTVWKNSKGAKTFSETVFVAYFQELPKTKQPSTLWSVYSMPRATVSTSNNIQINTYARLIAFLKRQSEGHKAKKSKVLSAENINTFLNEALDHSFLALKVALIFGVAGACRGQELLNITIDDIQKHSASLILLNLKDTKNKTDRSFVIRDDYVKLVDKYQSMRPGGMASKRFFITYHNGKCTKQVIGKNKISQMPKEIARYLDLSNPEQYTGHCFRRTSATILADSGADLTAIKRHGGWKSSTVAEGYIDESVDVAFCHCASRRIAESIRRNRPLSPQPGTSASARAEDIAQAAMAEQATAEELSPTFTMQEPAISQTFTESSAQNTQINKI